MAIHGRRRAGQPSNLYNITPPMKHIGYIITYSFSQLIIIRTYISGIFIRKYLPVEDYDGNPTIKCFLYHRSNGSSFIGGNYKQIYPFLNEMANIFYLLCIIVFHSTNIHFHSVIEKCFAQHFIVHLVPPFIVTALGNADTEMHVAMRTRSSQPKEGEHWNKQHLESISSHLFWY